MTFSQIKPTQMSTGAINKLMKCELDLPGQGSGKSDTCIHTSICKCLQNRHRICVKMCEFEKKCQLNPTKLKIN